MSRTTYISFDLLIQKTKNKNYSFIDETINFPTTTNIKDSRWVGFFFFFFSLSLSFLFVLLNENEAFSLSLLSFAYLIKRHHLSLFKPECLLACFTLQKE
jgi:4-hydroxybenzoate polyprenyltransferase